MSTKLNLLHTNQAITLSPKVERFIKGLVKKHGSDFALNLKYLTANDKIKKRHGEFVDLVDDRELVLVNRDKGNEKNHFEISRILDIEKR